MTIYPAGTTNFDYQGYGTLYDAYSAEVTEASSTNGNITETMEITYPVNGVLSDKIVEGNLVKAQISKTDGDYQIFEIDETEKSDNTVITAYLNAYPYRVLRMSFTNGGKFANFETLTRLLDYAKSYMPDLPTDFKITTNISNPINLAQVQTDPSLTPVPTVFKDFSSLLDAILNKVSGQVKFGPRSIEILEHRGQDKSNIELRDDKNTNGISVKIDTTNIVNKIIPLLPVKDKDGNSTSGTVVGNIVTPKDPFRFINFYSGQVVNVDTQDLANSYFSRTNCNYPVTTATVTTSMIDEDLSDIRLFDVVSVYSSRINYTAKLKVSERVFDVLAGAVDSFKLGTSSVNVFSTQTAAMNQVEQAVAIGNQALTSANGKNTNYYGDSKPTDGKEGDIWFHTVDGVSQMDQFTGGVWKNIVSDTFGKEVDEKVATAQAEASDAVAKAEEASSNAKTTADKFDDTNQKVEQALNNSVSAQADASSAVAKAESTASEFGKVSQKTDSAVANALSAQASASDAVKQASSAAADSKDAKQIAGAVSQSYKTLTDGSTMTIAELQNGLAAKLTKTDLKGYATQDWSQNQIKITADGINGTMSSIKSTVDSQTTSINDLKDDSSSFNRQFTTVSDTIGKHTTDISTLQASSKELTSGFNTLTTDNTTNKDDISQLKQTSTEVSSTLETVKTQVQDSAVGTNLIVAKTITNHSTIANGVPFGYSPAFITDYIPVVANKKYTISIYGTTNSCVSRIAYYDSSKNFISRKHDTNISTGSSEVIVIPSGASYIRFSPNTPDESGQYKNNFKMEKGSLATDWCANPADNATVTAVSKISQTVDSMQTDISKKIEHKDLNGYATQDWSQNQIKLTADGINGTLSSVQDQYNGISQSQGRNYVRNSQFDSNMDNWSVTAGSNVLKTDTTSASQHTRGKSGLHIYGTTTGNFQGIRQSIPLKMTKGQKFVIGMLQSFDGYASEGKLHIGVQYSDSNGTLISQEWHDLNCDNSWNNVYGRNSCIFTAMDNCSSVNLMIYAPGPNYVLNAYITEVSLTVGPTSFGWQEAPEDTATYTNTKVAELKVTVDGFSTTFAKQTDLEALNGTVSQHTTDIGTIQADATHLSSNFDSLDSDNKTNQHNIGELQQSAKDFSNTLLTVKNSGGGTNLIANSANDIIADDTINKNGFCYKTVYEGLIAGQQYTFTSDVTVNTGNVAQIRMRTMNNVLISDGPGENVDIINGHISWTFIAAQDKPILLVYAGVDSKTAGNKVTFHHYQLETGIVAHDWSPSPEDLATVTAVSSISQTIDKIQGTIINKADQSQITQLADQITSVVGSADNKVLKPWFDDGKTGTWNSTSTEIVATDTNVQKLTGHSNYLRLSARDNYEGGAGWFPVTPGEVYYFSGYMGSWGTTYPVNVGLNFIPEDGTHSWIIAAGFPANSKTSISAITGSITVPAGVVRARTWVQIDGPRGTDLGYASISGLRISKSASSSQITQLKDDINLRVEKNGVINAVNVSTEGIQIYGNKLHITASTYIDNAVIKDAMISNVSANKMTTGTLNAANVNVINLNGSNIVSNSITSNQLASGSVTANKIQSGAIRVSLNNSLQRLEIGVDGLNLMSNDGAIIGRIHSNHMNYDSTFWGLSFDMSANGGDYMAWGAQNNGDVNGLYQTKLAWYRWSTHGFDGGFHFQDRVEFHNPVEFKNSIDARANYLLQFGSTNVSGYSSVPYLGLSGGATKISFSPGSVWLSRHNNYYNMGAVIEGFSHYLGRAIFIPTGMHNDGRASSWLGINIPSA